MIKEDAYMEFYNQTKSLYIEMVAPGVGLGTTLLQTRSNTGCHKDEVQDNRIFRPIAFASKHLTGEDKRYSNIESKALGILYRLEKFHHFCFVKDVSIITDHKPLVTFKKNIATLSQRLQ